MRHFFVHMFDAGWETSPASWIGVVWSVWALSWMAAAIWSRQTAARANFSQEAPYRIITIIGVILLFGFFDFRSFPYGWDVSETVMWALLALVVAGFLF